MRCSYTLFTTACLLDEEIAAMQAKECGIREDEFKKMLNSYNPDDERLQG